MFSITSNAPVSNAPTLKPESNEDKTLHRLIDVCLDVLEEQNCLIQGWSNDTSVDENRTESKTMNNLNVELADEFEVVLAGVKKHNGQRTARNAGEGSSLTAACSARCSGTEYTCDICQAIFKTAHRLGTHKMIHDPRGSYKCKTCGKCFLYSTGLAHHMNRKIQRQHYYKCNKCFKRFIRSSSLSRHEISHKSDNSKYCFRCVFCSKVFARGINLESHMNLHKSNGGFQCSHCKRRFYRQMDLKTHERSHGNHHKHFLRCKICRKCFDSASRLANHMISHTNERPHKCHMCDKRYKRESDLRKHINIKHCGQPPYKCTVCDEKFRIKRDCEYHQAFHDVSSGPGPGPMHDKCGETFSRRDEPGGSHVIATHCAERSFKCRLCGFSSVNQFLLEKHEKLHDPARHHKCDVCDYRFSRKAELIAHKRTHTGERPYKCDMCGQAFSTNRGRIRHQKRHGKATI